MELRVQAQFTIFHSSEPDMGLCRAYMPYKCYNEVSTLFDYNNPEHLKHAYDWEWFNNKDNERWEPTDLHTKTTLTAFPELADKTETKEFKKKWFGNRKIRIEKIVDKKIDQLREEVKEMIGDQE